jgi:hypothetical protein
VKKRGRPYKSAESLAKARAKANGEYIPGRRGRPVKTIQPVHEEVAVPLATYVPFICEWKGCTARLHNLETLKKHVIAMHGKKGGAEEKVCAWGKCGGAIHHTENRIAEYFGDDGDDSDGSDDINNSDDNQVREDSVISVSSNVSVVIVVSKDIEEPQLIFESKIFASWKERNEHINEAHFLPFSWHVGDGPKATSLGT